MSSCRKTSKKPVYAGADVENDDDRDEDYKPLDDDDPALFDADDTCLASPLPDERNATNSSKSSKKVRDAILYDVMLIYMYTVSTW